MQNRPSEKKQCIVHHCEKTAGSGKPESLARSPAERSGGGFACSPDVPARVLGPRIVYSLHASYRVECETSGLAALMARFDWAHRRQRPPSNAALILRPFSPVLTGRRVGGFQFNLETDSGGIEIFRCHRSAKEREDSFGHWRPQAEISAWPNRVADRKNIEESRQRLRWDLSPGGHYLQERLCGCYPSRESHGFTTRAKNDRGFDEGTERPGEKFLLAEHHGCERRRGAKLYAVDFGEFRGSGDGVRQDEIQ